MHKNVKRKDKTIDEIRNVTTPNKEASSDPIPMKGWIINAELVNLRDQVTDFMSSKVIGTLRRGEEVTILSKDEIDNAYKVMTKRNKLGYVYAKYVEEVR